MAISKRGPSGGIAVAPSAPDIVYAGMGEACVQEQFLGRRRRLQVDGRRPVVDLDRPGRRRNKSDASPFTRRTQTSCSSRPSATCSAPAASGASSDRRTAERRGSNVLFVNDEAGSGRRDHRSARSRHDLRDVLARQAQTMGALQRRTRQRSPSGPPTEARPGRN